MTTATFTLTLNSRRDALRVWAAAAAAPAYGVFPVAVLDDLRIGSSEEEALRAAEAACEAADLAAGAPAQAFHCQRPGHNMGYGSGRSSVSLDGLTLIIQGPTGSSVTSRVTAAMAEAAAIEDEADLDGEAIATSPRAPRYTEEQADT